MVLKHSCHPKTKISRFQEKHQFHDKKLNSVFLEVFSKKKSLFWKKNKKKKKTNEILGELKTQIKKVKFHQTFIKT